MGLLTDLKAAFGNAARDVAKGMDAEVDRQGAAPLPLAFAKFYPGGLPAFLDRLRRAGHAEAVESWLGTGENRILPPGAYAALLGPVVAKRLAVDFGVPDGRVPEVLAAFLPAAVHGLSQDGRIAPQPNFSTQAPADAVP